MVAGGFGGCVRGEGSVTVIEHMARLFAEKETAGNVSFFISGGIVFCRFDRTAGRWRDRWREEMVAEVDGHAYAVKWPPRENTDRDRTSEPLFLASLPRKRIR